MQINYMYIMLLWPVTFWTGFDSGTFWGKFPQNIVNAPSFRSSYNSLLTSVQKKINYMIQIMWLIFTARRYASAVLAVVVCPSVCLSVCPSVTSRYCIETATHRITQTTPYGSPGNLVFWRQKSFRNSNGVAPKGGAKCRWGRVKSANVDK